MKTEEINYREELLQAWMRMSVCIRGNRILKDMSLNEILVCNQLYKNRDDPQALTATALGRQIRLLKSQVNKILSDLEAKGLIERDQSEQDRRKVYIRLREEAVPQYWQEHERVMALVGAVVQDMGEERAADLAQLVHEAIESVERYVAEQVSTEQDS